MKFERLELLVGNENLNLIQDKIVMIVGWCRGICN